MEFLCEISQNFNILITGSIAFLFIHYSGQIINGNHHIAIGCELFISP